MKDIYPLPQESGDGHGLDMVFVHGWGSDNRLWDTLRQQLPGRHWGLDLPGFGTTCSPELTDLDDFLERASQGLPEQCLLVGWSLGGMIATRLAALRPDRVVGLITLACNPCFVARSDWPWAMPVATYQQFCRDFAEAPHKTWLRFCALQGQGERQNKTVVRQLKQQPAPAPAQLAHWQNTLHWLYQLDNRAALSALSVPNLHLLGAQDALVPSAWAESWNRGQQNVPGLPKAAAVSPQIQVLAERGHCLLLVDSEPVVAAMLEFIHQLEPPIIKARVAQSFTKAAESYDAAAHTQVKVGQRLWQWLPETSAQARVLDLGCGTGFVSRQWLRSQLLVPQLVHLDLAEGMVRYARGRLSEQLPDPLWLVGDGERLPFAAEVFTGVISNLAIQWCANLPQLAAEVVRVLRPGGWFLCSTLGPDTLYELKSAWRSLDEYVHVNRFYGPQAVQHAFCVQGLSVERFERQTLVEEYPQLLPMVKDLKAIGAHNMNVGCKAGLTSIQQWRALEQAYEVHRSGRGMLPATYDVFYLLVRKP